MVGFGRENGWVRMGEWLGLDGRMVGLGWENGWVRTGE